MSFLYSGSLWSSLYCGVSSLCVGLYRWLVKVSWLGKLVLMFWWMELYFFSLLSKSWVAFLGAWCPLPAFRSCFVEFTRCLNALLMNLWERKCSPCPTPPPSWLLGSFIFVFQYFRWVFSRRSWNSSSAKVLWVLIHRDWKLPFHFFCRGWIFRLLLQSQAFLFGRPRTICSCSCFLTSMSESSWSQSHVTLHRLDVKMVH